MNLTRPGLEQPQGPSRGPGSTLPAPSSAAAVADRSSRPATTRRWGPPENHAENHGKTTTFHGLNEHLRGILGIPHFLDTSISMILFVDHQGDPSLQSFLALEIECFVASEILLRNSAEIGFEGPLRGQIPRSC